MNATYQIHSMKVCTLLLTLSITCIFSAAVSAQKISTDLLLLYKHQDVADCMVVMTDQLDLYGQTDGLTKDQKAAFVSSRLASHAQTSQSDIIRYFASEAIDHQTFSIFNGMQAYLTHAQAMHIVAHFDVQMITYNEPSQIQELGRPSDLDRRMDAEWGIMQIGADSVWQLGYEGDGVVVGGQDTGYDWDNSLIKSRYRGYDNDIIDHNYNWHDAIDTLNALNNDSLNSTSAVNPCGFLSSEPCDDHGHGSHTMGTMVGQDSANQIGVAPAASWIGCRNMDRGWGKPSTYTECFEWFLAPTDLEGQNPDPSKAPHVIANSWGCPPSEGCNESNWAFMETVVNNLSAAGTLVVVSAGNSGGEGCGSVSSPAAIFENSFTVGASDINDAKGGFSSIGPVTVDSSYRLKPDVVAPGVQVRSIYLNEQFRTWNGTSMAGPHVAGAVALIINANPALAGQVDVIKDILRSTAVPLIDSTKCEGIDALSIPNFYYGHGRIDALAAVNRAIELTSVIDPQTPVELQPYPNPNNGEFRLSVTSDIDWSKMIISDLMGRPASYSIDLLDMKNAKISGLLPGTYIYTIHIDGTRSSGKVVVTE